MQIRRIVTVATVSLALSCNEAQLAEFKGGKVYRLPTTSMEPTIARQEKVIADEIPAGTLVPRNAIVIHVDPRDGKAKMIERVVALPGETVEIRNKELLINGQAVREPFAVHRDAVTYNLGNVPNLPEAFKSRDNFGPLTLGPDEYFLMGDNRDESYDSRFLGPVSREQIEAIVHTALNLEGNPRRLGERPI